MTKAICLVGLPGSGKTYLANELIKTNSSLVLIDDMMDGTSLHTAIEYFKKSISCVLIDVHFCCESTRRVAEHFLTEHCGVEVEWIFFENNPSKCYNNVILRHDGRKVDGAIKLYEKFYRVPEGIAPRIIWQKEING